MSGVNIGFNIPYNLKILKKLYDYNKILFKDVIDELIILINSEINEPDSILNDYEESLKFKFKSLVVNDKLIPVYDLLKSFLTDQMYMYNLNGTFKLYYIDDNILMLRSE